MKLIPIIFIGILLLIGMVCATSLTPTDYTYVVTHQINGSATGAVTNYPMSIVIHNITGSSSGEDLYVNASTTRSDWGDVRFSTDNATELLYWIENNTGTSTSQRFWFNMPSIPQGVVNQTSVYIYYGNSSKTRNDDIQLTFQTGGGDGDDFNGASLNATKWTTATGTVAVAGGVVNITNTASSTSQGIKSASAYGYKAIRFRSRLATNSTVNYNEIGFDAWGSDNTVIGWMMDGTPPQNKIAVESYNGTQTFSVIQYNPDTIYHVYDLLRDNSSSIRGKNESISYVSVNATIPTVVLNATIRPYYTTGTPANMLLSTDWLVVRNLVSPEPTHSTYGSSQPVSNEFTLTPLPTANDPFTSWTIASDFMLDRVPGQWDDNQIVDAGVYYIGGEYKMYYSGYKSGYKYQIGYASSPDMKTWTKKGVVLTPLASETSGVSFNSMITLPNGTYRMYFKSLYATPPYDNVTFAQSINGINWTRYGTAIINCNASTFYDVRFDPEAIYFDNESSPKWIMLFGAYHDSTFKTGRATSDDGISWTISDTPVLNPGASGQWDDNAAYVTTINKMGNTYYMLYQGVDESVSVGGISEGHWRIGLATSNDTINWTKYAGNPVMDYPSGLSLWSSENPSDPIITPDAHKFIAAGTFGAYQMTSYDTANITSDLYPTPQNGYIMPLVPQTVDSGSNITFDIVPAENYKVGDVLVDGISVGAVSNYTFSSILANHNISATFLLENAPIVSFTSNTSSGTQPLTVQFNDTSATGITAWNWSYTNVTPGNNTPIYWSTIQNATQTFGVGHWHINLNVTNASGYNNTLLNYSLDVTPPTVTANFTGTPLVGVPGTAVTFTDSTNGSGISAWTYNWSFGDGVVNTTANPVHTYSANGVYDVNLTVYNASVGYSSKVRSGYITISDSGGLSGWNRQDILMDQIYSLTLRIKDTSTHNGIPSAAIQLSNGDNTTTDMFGVATFSMNYSAVVVSVGATGYYSRTISYVVDRDRTETIYLTEVAESPNSQSNLNLLYPHEVRIIAIDSNGGRLSNVVVSTVMLNTTTYGTNWWQYLYGISASATPMENTTMYGNTDAYGSIVFPMISSSLYRISFSQPSTGVSKTLDLYPDQMAYTFVLATTATAAIANSADYINQTLTVLEASPLIYLNMTYSDSGHTTSDITFYVKYANQTPANTQTFPSVAGSNQTVNTSYAVTNIKGDAYVWGFAANNTRFGWINNSQGITLKGASGVLYNPFIYKGEW